jgi:hypothetical protein
MPGDCLHLRGLLVDSLYRLNEYEIVQSRIVTNVTGTITAEYVAARDDQTTWSFQFVLALRLRVEAALLRLKEDFGEANNRDRAAELAVSRAKVRNDQEQPGRRVFRSALLWRRRDGVRGRSL